MDSKIKSALDAAGTAADYSARATYQRGYDAGVASVEAREWALVRPYSVTPLDSDNLSAACPVRPRRPHPGSPRRNQRPPGAAAMKTFCQNHISQYAPNGECRECDVQCEMEEEMQAKIDSLVVQRDAAEALVAEQARDMGRLDADLDAAKSLADWRLERLTASLAREREATDERDAAQQMVAEITAAAQGVVDAWHEPERPYVGERMDILGTTLGKSAPIANRWCLASDRDEAEARAETNHRREVAAHRAGCAAEYVANSLLAQAYDYVGTNGLGDMGPRIRAHLDAAPAGVAAPRRGDMLAEALHKMRVDLDAAIARAEKAERQLASFKAASLHAERRESELGLQVVAQAARLRLADELAAKARDLIDALDGSDDIGACDFGSSRVQLERALAAWDAVPGMEP